MDVDALAKAKVGKKGVKGKDKESKSNKFDDTCFWCGAYGHMMEDGQKKAAGKPQVPKSSRGADPKPKGKGKDGKGKKGALSLDEWPDGQEDQPFCEKTNEEVASLFIGAVSGRDWQAWEKIQRQAQRQCKSYKSGDLGANAVDAEMGERIKLTMDSGCAACFLPVGVASAVGMQELNRTTQEYIAANSEKIRELGCKIPTRTNCTNLWWQRASSSQQAIGSCCNLKTKVVLSTKMVRSKRRKRIFEGNGVYVLPRWVVKQSSQKRLAFFGRVVPKRPEGLPVSPVTSAETNMDVGVEESRSVSVKECGPTNFHEAVVSGDGGVEACSCSSVVFQSRSGITQCFSYAIPKLVLCVCPWPRTFAWSSQS